MLGQRRRLWANIVSMYRVCWVIAQYILYTATEPHKKYVLQETSLKLGIIVNIKKYKVIVFRKVGL